MIDLYPELRATSLIEKYPQFTSAGALVIDAIVAALPQVDADVFGTRADLAIELLACDWLMTHEYGTSLRGQDEADKPSRFRMQYDQIFKQVARRMMVL